MSDQKRVDNLQTQPIESEPKAEMTSVDVVSFYNELNSLGIQIWVDGGWGVDALLDKQTRPHRDLDIAIEEKDVPGLRELLEKQGYKEVKLEETKPHNFVLADNKGHEVDVHVFVLDGKGNGIYGGAESGQMYPAASLSGNGTIDGQAVKCISPEWMVKFHSGYALKAKDFRDVSALCEKFGIELPEEYSKSTKINQ